MKDLAEISHEDFESFLNDVFSVKIEDETGAEVELIQVKVFGDPDPDAKTRQPFSLLFRGPKELEFPQQMFQLENPKFGKIAMFLVPVGPDEEGILYDATFN